MANLARGQTANEIIISVNYNNVALKKVLADLEKRSSLHFIYANENVEPYSKVSFKADKISLAEVLNKMLKPTHLIYKEEGKKILIINRPARKQEALPKKIFKIAAIPIKGRVTDNKGEPLTGVTVKIKGTIIGTFTDADGNYSINVPNKDVTLLFAYIGYLTQEIEVRDQRVINMKLAEDSKTLKDVVVVVGYATQKKASVVGAISTVTGETLERRGGVTNLASALSGQMGGVTVLETTGEPGRDDPQILVRGQSTWNGSQPLILVDGIERKMNDVSVNDVANISVLKDASATAVFGVKGANGVILITTKRGEAGKAKLSLYTNMGVKSISRLPGKLDAFEAQKWKNAAIENEVAINEASWRYILPYEQVLRSKSPQQDIYKYLYPNVDWQKEATKDFATNRRVNMDVRGGTDFATYFASIGYVNEGDILASHYNEQKGYDPGYAYNRFNFRGNLNFNITKTTKLQANITGYNGIQKKSNYGDGQNGHIFRALYDLAPDAFPVKYEDGIWGKDPANTNMHNPVSILQESGILRLNRGHIGIDMNLDQKLDFITKGLSAGGSVAWDNYSATMGPNVIDMNNQGQTIYKFINTSILDAKTRQDSLNAITIFPSEGIVPINEFDLSLRPWVTGPVVLLGSALDRRLFYQFKVNYARTFGQNDFSGLFLVSRRQQAVGPEFAHFQEDWVGRLTYSYGGKYFAETNGAYNGSEKFAPKNRFGFFPSFAAGWMVSKEKFLKKYTWLDKLKIRGSWGKVGSDQGIPRWGYVSSWLTGGSSYFSGSAGFPAVASPYTNYKEGVIANPDLTWETSTKKNIGAEISILQSMLSASVDFYKERRTGIFMNAALRNVPVYFGAAPVAANLGETKTQGYELQLDFNKRAVKDGFGYWVQLRMEKSIDEIVKGEDPELLPDYQKLVGFQIGQPKSQVSAGYLNNWDQVYASTPLASNMAQRLPGDWDIVDYNGDGVINNFDNVAYGRPTRPTNTYSTSFGFNYKRFTFMVQFYAVTNINLRAPFTLPTAVRWSAVSKEVGNYWTAGNTNADFKAPRLITSSPLGSYGLYDGSYVRLKTAEFSYTLPEKWSKSIALSNARLYINGNNLVFWSDLPTDRETGGFDIQNAYPMFRQFNIGASVSF